MRRLGRALHRRSPPLALLPLLARLMDHLLALGGARVVPLLAQHLAALRRQLLELVKILPHLRLLLRRLLSRCGRRGEQQRGRGRSREPRESPGTAWVTHYFSPPSGLSAAAEPPVMVRAAAGP